MKTNICSLICVFLVVVSLAMPRLGAESVARTWNEQNLAAIRLSFPDPPVHARNLFHVSVAMYDAWAAYDPVAVGYVYNGGLSGAPNAGAAPPIDLAAARHEAISYAAYRVLVARYLTDAHPKTPAANGVTSKAAFDQQMADFGYPTGTTTTVGTSPAAVGNRVAEAVLSFAGTDGSREQTGYDDPTYAPANDPLILAFPGTQMDDPNRWQPLAFEVRFTQNGLEADSVQTFVGAHWGDVRPFALSRGPGEALYHDPGPPPYLGGEGDEAFRQNSLEVVRFSSWLDPDSPFLIDASPDSWGRNSVGHNDGTGYSVNPMTGLPYAPNYVKRADFGRVLAEFWADGPQSETPPGHWNTIANEVVGHPLFARRIEGRGQQIDELEWDVKMYFPLNGAVHDVAVAVWGVKRHYDYVRPISSIRHLGQNNLLPIEPGLCEIVTAASSQPGNRHAHLANHIGETAILAWGGEPGDPETEYTGAEWILAENWLPYQRDTFVTPAFAGYVSGHSGFSRASAEVLTALTGSPFFPGGLGSYTAPAGSLEFEFGPSEDITLQWATYYDAADQAGISRLYGGIHVAPDDGPGRLMGSRIGMAAWELAKKYYDGSILAPVASGLALARKPNGDMELTWDQHRGLFYAVGETMDFQTSQMLVDYQRAETDRGRLLIPAGSLPPGRCFYRVLPSATGE